MQILRRDNKQFKALCQAAGVDLRRASSSKSQGTIQAEQAETSGCPLRVDEAAWLSWVTKWDQD
eukprot:3820251-Pyramimonas_sp.AAC.1